jgi:hypothetical protein
VPGDRSMAGMRILISKRWNLQPRPPRASAGGGGVRRGPSRGTRRRAVIDEPVDHFDATLVLAADADHEI